MPEISEPATDGDTTPCCPASLWIVGLLNLTVHVAGAVLAWTWLRPGMFLVSMNERLAWLAEHPTRWTIAWLVWMGCALLFVLFQAVLAGYLARGSVASVLALALGVAAFSIDVLGDALQIGLVPRLAARAPETLDLLTTVERGLSISGCAVANMLSSIAVLVMTIALAGSPRGLSLVARLLGLGTFGFGLLLAAAGIVGVPHDIEVATAPVLVMYCAWTVAVMLSLSRSRRGAGPTSR